jgi:WD40 repeat protein
MSRPLDPAWYSGPTSDMPLLAQHDRSVLALDFNTAGDSVVTASADHGLRIYNMRSGK